MSAFLLQRKKPSLSKRLSRLVVRLRDPEWQRYGKLLLLGKALGVAMVLLLITLVSGLFLGRVYAADAELKAADIVNPINTVWTLIAAFLVFGMQVGFTMLEAGFCRSRETVNVLMECIVDTCLCGLLN
jgi:ammonium transporter, Amt family